MFFMSDKCDPIVIQQACEVTSTQQMSLHDEAIELQKDDRKPTFKVPVVLAERKIQIVVESDISLTPAATEIKRVTKNVFLEQVKLVPVRFKQIGHTDFLKLEELNCTYQDSFVKTLNILPVIAMEHFWIELLMYRFLDLRNLRRMTFLFTLL